MNIHNIIYDTTRSIYGVEDKLSIVTIFLFCNKMNSKLFSELLYTEDHEKFINKINEEYKEFEVDFTIRLSDKNVRSCFYATLEKIISKFDSNKYYKALFENDPFALVINEIANYDFDKKNFKKFRKEIVKQLELNF